MEDYNLEKKLEKERSDVRNEILRRNRISGPISIQAERLLEQVVNIELKYPSRKEEYDPYYYASGIPY